MSLVTSSAAASGNKNSKNRHKLRKRMIFLSL
ncbi:hypothetical protein VCHC57A1_1169, partial [Vibrio cholerae HC-57A1]